MTRDRVLVVAVIGTTQTLAWASSYYLPAVLAEPMARDLGTTTTAVFAAVSGALLLSASLGPSIGRRIDAAGGRGVLALSNLVLASGLLLLGIAHSLAMLWIAWLTMGLGMSLGLYDSAFATLGRLYGASARPSIAGITLFAGFASTIGWPMTAWGLADLGWRETCFLWAAAHLALGLPLNLLFIPRTARTTEKGKQAGSSVRFDRDMLLLAVAFSLGWIVSGAMAAHLPKLLEGFGASPAQAIAAGALVGPAQVAGRLMEIGVLGRLHPLLSARLASLAHPLAAGALAMLGVGIGADAFALIHGAGNGIASIVKGTVPIAIFGSKDYGQRLGLLGAPERVAQAFAPFLFQLLIDATGSTALVVSSALSLASLGALMMVSLRRRLPSGDGGPPISQA